MKPTLNVCPFTNVRRIWIHILLTLVKGHTFSVGFIPYLKFGNAINNQIYTTKVAGTSRVISELQRLLLIPNDAFYHNRRNNNWAETLVNLYCSMSKIAILDNYLNDVLMVRLNDVLIPVRGGGISGQSYMLTYPLTAMISNRKILGQRLF